MGLVCGCQLVTGALDAEAMKRSVENLAYDAVVVYSAQVPGTRDGAPVETMVFNADEEKALFQMFAIAEDSSQRWDANVSVAQRLGELIPGDTSLCIAVACIDWEDAFECSHTIARKIAEAVPVWGA